MERSWDSSPQSRTTTQEQLTTFRALPSRSSTPGVGGGVSCGLGDGGKWEGRRGKGELGKVLGDAFGMERGNKVCSSLAC